MLGVIFETVNEGFCFKLALADFVYSSEEWISEKVHKQLIELTKRELTETYDSILHTSYCVSSFICVHCTISLSVNVVFRSYR